MEQRPRVKSLRKRSNGQRSGVLLPPAHCVLTGHIRFGRSPDSKVSLGHSRRSGGGHSEPCHHDLPLPKTVASEQLFINARLPPMWPWVKTSEVWEVPTFHPSLWDGPYKGLC